MPRRAPLLVVSWLFVPPLGMACRASDPPKRASDAPELATTPAAATASHLEAPATPGALPNLLDVVPARMAVSSTVVNPHDFPEHIADGRMDTAWNSKTGDLVGSR